MRPRDYVRRFPLFDPLSDEAVALLEAVFVVTRHPPGHVLVREGDRAHSVTAALYLLIEGTVSVTSKAPEGGFGVKRTLHAGQVFGTVALVTDSPRTATCTTSSDATVAKLDRRSFDELFRRHVGMYAKFQLVIARSLAADLRVLSERLTGALSSGDESELRQLFADV